MILNTTHKIVKLSILRNHNNHTIHFREKREKFKPNSHVWMNMSKYTQIGSVKWLRKTIMWQEIITTLLSKYIRMKNHLAATLYDFLKFPSQKYALCCHL